MKDSRPLPRSSIRAVDSMQDHARRNARAPPQLAVPTPAISGFRRSGGMRTGADKTNTIRVILGLETPDEGRALIGGQPYAWLSRPLTQAGSLLDASALQGSLGNRGDPVADRAEPALGPALAVLGVVCDFLADSQGCERHLGACLLVRPAGGDAELGARTAGSGRRGWLPGSRPKRAGPPPVPSAPDRVRGGSLLPWISAQRLACQSVRPVTPPAGASSSAGASSAGTTGR